MLTDVALQALKDKQPKEYRRMKREGTLVEYLNSFNQLTNDAYKSLTRGADENGKAAAREILIAESVQEIERMNMPKDDDEEAASLL